jgi:hypothetical protein
MFWRSDPSGATQLLANTNWPRDEALIQGDVVTLGKVRWLRAHKVKQKNEKEWVDAPSGAFLPFEHDDHYYLEKYA